MSDYVISEFRIEPGLLGDMRILVNAYYLLHAQRASENLALATESLHPDLVHALAIVKRSCVLANKQPGVLSDRVIDAIAKASDEIAPGVLSDQFITDAIQGGASNSANTNMNEVLANCDIENLGGTLGDYAITHPIDLEYLSQSTNDVFPTPLRVAALWLLEGIAQALVNLQGVLQEEEIEYSDVLKLGRTEMPVPCP